MDITKDILEKAMNKCIGKSTITDVKLFSKGNINQTFEVKIKETDKKFIFRIFNEPWKAKKEEFIYRDIRAHIDVPVPEVYCVDISNEFMPFSYSIMSKIEGMHIDENYKKYKNKEIFEKAGEILAKIHSIKFPRFGWLLDNEIRPAFNTWKDFAWHDIEYKLNKIRDIKRVNDILPKIERYINSHAYLLNINDKPSLLHKDYHCSHIFADKEKITGIIDVEWAIAGHTENDFLKLELWTFPKVKDVRDSFFKGYLKYGSISNDYPDRKKIYELWHWISMVNISVETKNNEWLELNLSALEKLLEAR